MFCFLYKSIYFNSFRRSIEEIVIKESHIFVILYIQNGLICNNNHNIYKVGMKGEAVGRIIFLKKKKTEIRNDEKYGTKNLKCSYGSECNLVQRDTAIGI